MRKCRRVSQAFMTRTQSLSPTGTSEANESLFQVAQQTRIYRIHFGPICRPFTQTQIFVYILIFLVSNEYIFFFPNSSITFCGFYFSPQIYVDFCLLASSSILTNVYKHCQVFCKDISALRQENMLIILESKFLSHIFSCKNDEKGELRNLQIEYSKHKQLI